MRPQCSYALVSLGVNTQQDRPRGETNCLVLLRD